VSGTVSTESEWLSGLATAKMQIGCAMDEWVTTITFVDDSGILREVGAIYAEKPRWKARSPARPLDLLGEVIAVCSRCGQRFAATDDATAEENRDLHFNGDSDVPSICAPG
jgi:hypothetical protein